jgi:hypothetical protein
MNEKCLPRTIHWGETQACAGYVITPVYRSYIFQWPALHLRINWSHPLAVLVTGNGSREIIPVKDLTRRLKILIWTLALVISLLVLAARRSKNADDQAAPIVSF